jgi:hypothetical protein
MVDDVLISQLPDAAAIANADLMEVEQGVFPANKSGRVTLEQLKTFFTPAAVEIRAAVSTVASVAGILTLALDNRPHQYFIVALTENITGILFTGLPAAGFAKAISIRFVQAGSGGYTVVLPAAFKATGGSDTSIVTTLGAYTLLEAETFDQGTRWEYAMQECAA